MNILYVEDDAGLGSLMARKLRDHGHDLTIANSVEAAKASIAECVPDIALLDHDLGDGTGLELMAHVLSDHPDLPCVMVTGVGNEDLAVSAMKAGATDYVVKDIDNNYFSLLTGIIQRIGKERALTQDLEQAEQDKDKLQARNRYLTASLRQRNLTHAMLGQATSFKHILSIIEQVAPTDATVLISGETGTGKEVAARAIHDLSARSEQAFIAVNCAALPEGLIESELFGHEKGSFTGALRANIGRFEAADGGTLFLDEVGEIPIELQPKLLRVLQEATFERVGSSKPQKVDVRIVAATNQNLVDLIIEKQFREDLYYRLNVIPIQMPPLRERKSDIALLFMHFARKMSERHGLPIPATDEKLLTSLSTYHWPGNVRELINYTERGVITQRWEHLSSSVFQASSNEDSATRTLQTLDQVDRNHIISVLQQTGGVISGSGGAAQLLGLNANTLRSRMKRLGIKKPEFSQ